MNVPRFCWISEVSINGLADGVLPLAPTPPRSKARVNSRVVVILLIEIRLADLENVCKWREKEVCEGRFP